MQHSKDYEMYRVKVYANFEEVLEPILMAPEEVDLVIDYEIPTYLQTHEDYGQTVIFATIQPEGHFNDIIRQNQDRFDYLLTFIPELLTLPKARFFIGLTSFCKPDLDIPKIFAVSAVFSGRNACPGHPLRHELYKRRNEIKIPKFFYTGLRSGQRSELELPAEKSAKQTVMNCMFHIAIDSYNYPNSFSEKLIDPLITNTIPIYWGPENIRDYFNMDGIFRCDTVDEIIDVTNQMGEDIYYSRKGARFENYGRAIKYHNYGECLQQEINKIYGTD